MTTIIFDLDNCIGPANSVGVDLYEYAFATIRKTAAAQGFSPVMLEQAFNDCWFHPFKDVCATYQFSDAMSKVGFDAFASMEATRFETYSDFHYIKSISCRKILVTAGFEKLQSSKIAAIGAHAVFDHIVIDHFDAQGHRRGKLAIFEELQSIYQLQPASTWVVGDSPTSELQAAKVLGFKAVQTLRPGVEPWMLADFRISDFSELAELVC